MRRDKTTVREEAIAILRNTYDVSHSAAELFIDARKEGNLKKVYELFKTVVDNGFRWAILRDILIWMRIAGDAVCRGTLVKYAKDDGRDDLVQAVLDMDSYADEFFDRKDVHVCVEVDVLGQEVVNKACGKIY